MDVSINIYDEALTIKIGNVEYAGILESFEIREHKTMPIFKYRTAYNITGKDVVKVGSEDGGRVSS